MLAMTAVEVLSLQVIAGGAANLEDLDRGGRFIAPYETRLVSMFKSLCAHKRGNSDRAKNDRALTQLPT